MWISPRQLAGLVALLFLVVAIASEARADLIKLNNGGELRGQIEVKLGSTTGPIVTIETVTGATVVVAQEDIRFISRRPIDHEHFETRFKQAPRTVDALWELQEWCRSKGLTSQRDEVLESLLLLDPDHKEAHQALGHSLHDGLWMTRDEAMQAKGYVRHKGRYITPQELELIEKTEAELQAELEWYRTIRLWHTWLTGRHPDRSRKGYDQLLKLDDPNSVPALSKYLGEDEDVRVRNLYIDILSRLPGSKPVEPLALASLNDSDYELRYKALNGISRDQYDRAIPIYVGGLKNDSNVIVRRSGAALQRLGDERVVPHLIAALVTSHRYKVRVPATQPTISVSADGSFGNTGNSTIPPDVEAMLRTGQLPYGVIVNQPQPPGQQLRTKVVTVTYEHKNQEVLAALKVQTKQDFGYDERTWRLWLLAQKDPPKATGIQKATVQ